jgi:hypothetical protein
MKPRTHFKHTIDHLDALGEIIETIAGVDDFEIAETTWLAAVNAGREKGSCCAKGRVWCVIAGGPER